MKKNNRGLSLMELMAVVLIIGIVTSIALTNHGSQVEKAISREGEYNLHLLYNAQKRYKMNTGTYYGGGMFAPINNIIDINRNLTVMISEKNFKYTIWGTPNQFRILAERVGGSLCDGLTMSVDEQGNVVDKSSCPAWQ